MQSLKEFFESPFGFSDSDDESETWAVRPDYELRHRANDLSGVCSRVTNDLWRCLMSWRLHCRSEAFDVLQYDVRLFNAALVSFFSLRMFDLIVMDEAMKKNLEVLQVFLSYRFSSDNPVRFEALEVPMLNYCGELIFDGDADLGIPGLPMLISSVVEGGDQSKECVKDIFEIVLKYCYRLNAFRISEELNLKGKSRGSCPYTPQSVFEEFFEGINVCEMASIFADVIPLLCK